MPTPAGPNCAIENVFGVVVGTEYIGSNRIGTVPVGTAPSVTSVLVEFINGLALIAGAGQPDWLDTAPAPWTVRTEDAVDPLDSILKTFVYLNWRIDLTKVSSQTLSFQLGYRLNGVKDEFCIYMPASAVPLAVDGLLYTDSAKKLYLVPYADLFGTSPTLDNRILITGAIVTAGQCLFTNPLAATPLINVHTQTGAMEPFTYAGVAQPTIAFPAIRRTSHTICVRGSDGQYFLASSTSGFQIQTVPPAGTPETLLWNNGSKTVEMMAYWDDSAQIYFVDSDKKLHVIDDAGAGKTTLCATVNDSPVLAAGNLELDPANFRAYAPRAGGGFMRFDWSASPGTNDTIPVGGSAPGNLVFSREDQMIIFLENSDNRTFKRCTPDGGSITVIGTNPSFTVTGMTLQRSSP